MSVMWFDISASGVPTCCSGQAYASYRFDTLERRRGQVGHVEVVAVAGTPIRDRFKTVNNPPGLACYPELALRVAPFIRLHAKRGHRSGGTGKVT